MPSGTLWNNTSDVYRTIAILDEGSRTLNKSGTATTADTPVFGIQVSVSGAGITGDLDAGDQAILEGLFTEYAGSTIIIDRPVNISSDLTIPYDIDLYFTKEGKLAIDTDCVLTFQTSGGTGCSFNDVKTQIFDFTGDVKIEGSISLGYWRPEWFLSTPYVATTDSVAPWREMYEHYETSGNAFYPKKLMLTTGKTYYWAPFDIKTNYIYNDMVICCDSSGSRYGSTTVKSIAGLRCIGTLYDQGAVYCDEWQATTAYTVYTALNNQRIYSKINRGIWKCTTAGTTGATEPVWTYPGTVDVSTMSDGSVVWTLMSYYNDINTRIAIRDIQFAGYGTNGAGQTEYILQTSGFDLLVMQNVSIFYSKWGWVHDKTYHSAQPGYHINTTANGGAVVVDNIYCVQTNSSMVGAIDDTDGVGIRIAANIRGTNMIIENSYVEIYGSYFEGTSMINTHLESSYVNVFEGVFTLGIDGGQTSAYIVLHPQTHDCVVRGMAGSYTCMDLGYNNTIPNGHRGVWSNTFMTLPTTEIVDCAFPGPIATYLRCILPKGRKYLASIPVTRDQEVTEGIGTIDHEIYDVASASAYKTYVDIPSISTQYYSILHSRFEHIWDVFNTEDQNLWIGQREVDSTSPLNYPDATRYRFAHILNSAPDMKWDYVNGNNITEAGPSSADTAIGWYLTGAAPTLAEDATTGKIHFSGTGINFNYSQRIQLDINKEYVLVAKVESVSSGNCLVFSVNGTTSSPGGNTWVRSAVEIRSGHEANQDIRLCVIKFKPMSHGQTYISFGTQGTATFNCIVHFVALAELGSSQRMVSNGKPNCGVFTAGKTIYELNPAANSAYSYYAAPTLSGAYGVRWRGVAGVEGTWAYDTEMTTGDVWEYTGSPTSQILILQTHTITQWVLSTAYSLGELIVSSNRIWEVTTAGTSDTTASFSASAVEDDTHTDGTIEWTCRGLYVDNTSHYARYLYSLYLGSGYSQSGSTYIKTIVGS